MRLALLVMFSIGCASAPVCPTRANNSGPAFAWQVTGPSGSMIIQATHQGLDGSDVSAAALRELDRADIYITEADEAAGHEAADPGVPRPQFELATTTLDKLIAPRDFDALERAIGIDRAELSRMKPWVAFMLLARSRYTFADPSMNANLLERARAHELRTVFLETWDDQVRYLDAAITARKLTLAIRDPDQACRLDARLAAFRAGDDSAFINDIAPGEPVIARIDHWYPMLRAIAGGNQRSFVALGIGQLLGPYGILTRFSADGYQVRRL